MATTIRPDNQRPLVFNEPGGGSSLCERDNQATREFDIEARQAVATRRYFFGRSIRTTSEFCRERSNTR